MLKKHLMWLTTLLIIVSVLSTNVLFISNAAEVIQTAYYVSPTGSDSNPGTIDAPFQTITKARDVVRTINSNMTGDIYIYLRGGTYNIADTITFGPKDSGTNGYRIYYQAYQGETPVLNGATKVTGWTQYSGNIFKATLNRSTKLRNLYVNDQRALMTSKTVTARGGYGSYSVTAGQASWAWTGGSKDDGVKYNSSDVPAIASNKDDLEIVNGSTWNENIVCTRDVITTSDNYRVLLLQQPYGAIAQTPGWGAAFASTGTHTIYNAMEFLNSPGQFYFNKTTKTLYYYIRPGEDMSTADVEAPVAEKLIDISGASNTNKVKNITFQGITFENTDYNLVNVGGS
ncbi:MAG TPA: carbohydrate-binding protein, partial [Clostridia bacterium]